MNEIQAIQAALQAPSAEAIDAARLQPAEPDPVAIEKFNSIMQATDIRPENQIVKTATPTPVPFADRVSEAFHAAEGRQFASYEKIGNLVNTSNQRELSTTELLHLQYEISNLAFQQELVSKVIDRASNAVQTLFKNQ